MKKRPAAPVRKFLVAILLSTTFVACGDEASPGDDHLMGNTPNEGGHMNTATGDTVAGARCTTDTWDNYAQGFFATNCVTCHKAFTSLDNIQLKDEKVEMMIKTGRMPKGGHLDDVEKQRILRWLRCGLPQ